MIELPCRSKDTFGSLGADVPSLVQDPVDCRDTGPGQFGDIVQPMFPTI